MTTKIYSRDQLPQWHIEDVLEHGFSYYFGIENLKTLKPSQRPEDYEQDRVRRKLTSMKVGHFDPIITDCDFHIICGHHRYIMLKKFFNSEHHKIVPIICLEGATIDMVVQYYESLQLHKQAQLDWMAENRAIEDYDYMKLQNGKVVV